MKTKHNRRSKWTYKHLVTIYQLARQGMKPQGIARVLGVKPETFSKWYRKRPSVRDAFKRGQSGCIIGKSGETFVQYVYKRLSPKCKAVWDKLRQWENTANGPRKIEAMLDRQGKHVRQMLFIHALVASNFNASEACRRVCIGKNILDQWSANDPQFIDLLDEIHWHRKNFAEEGLWDLVAQRYEQSVLFVNKTLNADRFPDPKKTVEHVGAIGHLHVDMSILDSVSPECKREILAAIQKHKQKSIENNGTPAAITTIKTNVGVTDDDQSQHDD